MLGLSKFRSSVPSAIAEDLVGAQGRTGTHGKKFLLQGKYVYTAETRDPRLGKSTVGVLPINLLGTLGVWC